MSSFKQIYDFLKGNLYAQLIKRILVIYLLFTLCRLAFYWCNIDLYKEKTFGQLVNIFVGGLRFDTTAIFYTNALYILMFLIPFKFRYDKTYQTVGKYLYFIANGIALAANCMDIAYFPFTMRRTTFAVFTEFKDNDNLGSVFANAFVDYWYLVIVFIVLILLMIYMYGPSLTVSSVRIKNRAIYYPAAFAALLSGLFILFVGFRGGIDPDLRPITLSNAGAYATAPSDIPLILNTPFSIYRTIERKGIARLKYFDDPQAVDAIFDPIHTPSPKGPFTNENVMVIFLESFGREALKTYNSGPDGDRYENYAPFLDSLLQHGRSFMYSYANGFKSVDMMPAAFCGIPAIPDPFVLSGYYNNKLNALPALLREKGYETAFFCGHPNGAQSYTSFCNFIGFHRYYGKNEYGNDADYDGVWGIWDEEFFRFTAREIEKFSQPFFATLYTVTSHNPYLIPEKYEHRFPPEKNPLMRAIRYSDYSLRQFFETASKMPWYNNTLFVLTGDHTNRPRSEYQTPAGLFAVPIIFYKPDGSLKALEHKEAQHLDIMPTILSYLNYDRPYLSFGFDLNENTDRFAVNCLNNTYLLYTDKYLLMFDGQRTTGLYDLAGFPALSENLVGTLPEVQAESELKLKAFLQQYTARMVENRLTVNKE